MQIPSAKSRCPPHIYIRKHWCICRLMSNRCSLSTDFCSHINLINLTFPLWDSWSGNRSWTLPETIICKHIHNAIHYYRLYSLSNLIYCRYLNPLYFIINVNILQMYSLEIFDFFLTSLVTTILLLNGLFIKLHHKISL